MCEAVRPRANRERSAIAVLGSLILAGASCLVYGAAATAEYHAIHPTMTSTTVVLTGNDLTIEQVIQVARYGAQLTLSPEARQRNLDTFNLMNEGAAEGVPIYLFNRYAGAGREVARFEGDPMSPQNRPKLEAQALEQFKFRREDRAYGPEFSDEDVVRAMMVIRANQMIYLPASPGLLQGLIALINHDVTPVMRSRAGTGEAEGPSAAPMNQALVGAGEVYYQGERMPAAEALRRAGLQPIQPAPGDSTLGSINSDVAGLAAILVADARRYLEWADLVYAIDLDGMNSSLTPLFMPAQVSRPYPWINWEAARVMDMLRGSYLFNYDAAEQQNPQRRRIIQDPESLRASYIRQGSAWQAWDALRDTVTIQMNGTEHNPVTRVDVSPADSWELSTPWAMRYYVKGSAANGYKHGYVFSNANWDPYPLSNEIEAFTIALANMDIAVLLRQERFGSTFFTGVSAQSVLNPGDSHGVPGEFFGDSLRNHEAWQTIQGLIVPVPPEGYSADPEGVEELDAESLFKVKRAIQALDESWTLLGNDFYAGTLWMDVRAKQDPHRQFGLAPTAAWQAFRKVVQLEQTDDFGGASGGGDGARDFIETTPASRFYVDGPAMPARP
jgi:histidine ammonia-lyase